MYFVFSLHFLVVMASLKRLFNIVEMLIWQLYFEKTLTKPTNDIKNT